MKRLSQSLAVIALAAGSLAQAGAAQHDSAFPLLDATLAAPSKVSYTGVVQSLHGSVASIYRVEHRAPDLTLRTYSAPPQFFDDFEIVAGARKYFVDPRRRRIVESQNDAALSLAPLSEREALIRANYRSVRVGSERFDGRPTADVLLVSKYTSRSAAFVRVDLESKIVLDRQEFGPNGAVVNETRMESVRYAPVAAADFAIPKQYAIVHDDQAQEVSRDVDRVIRDAGFGARKPSLPEGFSALAGELENLHGARTVQVLYSDGIRTLSLFETADAVAPNMVPLHPQNVDLSGRKASFAEDGAVALLTWNDGTLYYTLVGDLGLTEFERIASTITP